MSLRNTPTAYGSLHKILHWVMALLLLSQFVIAWILINLPKNSSLGDKLFQWHVLIGLSILILVIARIIWRLSNPAVLPAETLKFIAPKASSNINLFLYFAMLLMPISGYLRVTAKGHTLTAFGLTIPSLWQNPSLAALSKTTHIYLAYILLGAIALHIISAFMRKGAVVLKRML